MINQHNSNLSGNNFQSRDFDCFGNNPSNNILVGLNGDKRNYNFAYQFNNSKITLLINFINLKIKETMK